MRTKITFYGEIAGNIWMPAVECSKEFNLELTRIPRNSTTRKYPGSHLARWKSRVCEMHCSTLRMTEISSPVPSLGQR